MKREEQKSIRCNNPTTIRCDVLLQPGTTRRLRRLSCKSGHTKHITERPHNKQEKTRSHGDSKKKTTHHLLAVTSAAIDRTVPATLEEPSVVLPTVEIDIIICMTNVNNDHTLRGPKQYLEAEVWCIITAVKQRPHRQRTRDKYDRAKILFLDCPKVHPQAYPDQPLLVHGAKVLSELSQNCLARFVVPRTSQLIQQIVHLVRTKRKAKIITSYHERKYLHFNMKNIFL